MNSKNTTTFFGQRFVVVLTALVFNIFSSTALSETKIETAQSDIKVIGYIASFTDMKAAINKTDLSKLTHINIRFYAQVFSW